MSKQDFKLFDDMVKKSEAAIPLVQILDEKGKLVNKGMKSSLTDEELVELMKVLVWGRTTNERLILAGRQGRIGNLPPSEGQEASQLATLFAMKKEDFVDSFSSPWYANEKCCSLVPRTYGSKYLSRRRTRFTTSNYHWFSNHSSSWTWLCLSS
jgi:hypothetical protein